jgi:hypothetical protein
MPELLRGGRGFEVIEEVVHVVEVEGGGEAEVVRRDAEGLRDGRFAMDTEAGA